MWGGGAIFPAPPWLWVLGTSCFAYIHIHTGLTKMHTHTHRCTQPARQTWRNSPPPPKTRVGPAAPGFQGSSSRNTTADCETHKHTCSVLRHADMWRFLVVTHRVFSAHMTLKKKKKSVSWKRTRKQCPEQTWSKSYSQIFVWFLFEHK